MPGLVGILVPPPGLNLGWGSDGPGNSPANDFKHHRGRTSPVVQWLRIRLPMQATWSLVQKDFTCCGATKPVHSNYWAYSLESMLFNKRSHCNEKPGHLNENYLPPAPKPAQPTNPSVAPTNQQSQKVNKLKKKTKSLGERKCRASLYAPDA